MRSALKMSSEKLSEKLTSYTEKITQKTASLLVTRLDSIVWILNIRGQDIPYSPVLFGYLLIENKSGWKYTLYPRDFSKYEPASVQARVVQDPTIFLSGSGPVPDFFSWIRVPIFRAHLPES